MSDVTECNDELLQSADPQLKRLALLNQSIAENGLRLEASLCQFFRSIMTLYTVRI